LASTAAKRASIAPDLPTISEAALPGYDTGVWFGLLAPAGTAGAVIDKLSKAGNEALTDPDVLRQLGIQGLEARGGSAEDFRVFIKAETERWEQVIRSTPQADKNK
jgi:tripartite-type tricarboxylate transporter receptor subunit TctC